MYGHKQDPVSISVSEGELLEIVKHGAHVMNVKINGQAQTCLVKDLQFGYLGDNVIHVDFARVDLDEEVHVNVHIKFLGKPAGAEKPGAVVTHDLTELEVICKVNAIPDEIRVDQSGMTDMMTVANIALPAGVRAAVPADTPIAHISFVHEETAGEAVAVEGEGPEPEVIGAKEREEKAKEKEGE
jgi:large subunit ribosomal protein L25